MTHVKIQEENVIYGLPNISAPPIWDKFRSKFWDFIVEKGPIWKDIEDGN